MVYGPLRVPQQQLVSGQLTRKHLYPHGTVLGIRWVGIKLNTVVHTLFNDKLAKSSSSKDQMRKSQTVYQRPLYHKIKLTTKTIFFFLVWLMRAALLRLIQGVPNAFWNSFLSCGERTGLVVRASDSESGDPGSILGRVGVLFP